MSGNGTTGGKISPNYKAGLWSPEAFSAWLDTMTASYRLQGPARSGSRTVFREVSAAAELDLEGGRTMIPPGKVFFYRARQQLLQFDLQGRTSVTAPLASAEPALLVGIRPCDLHALLYLDQTFKADPYYRAVRQKTLLLAVNCRRPTPYCFCASLGTGPFYKSLKGCDAVLTKLAEGWLVEPREETMARLLAGDGKPVSEQHWQEKAAQEQAARSNFEKSIELKGLEPILRRNQEHPVWSRTAAERCLSCTNCVMVCPTCFCHEIRDRVEMDLRQAVRYRQWDACQDLAFAAVHGGNFRQTRQARLRQFVLHKLDFTAQYGQAGTVGCGRCIEWCPTAIDLTEMAKEIRQDAEQ